MPVVPLANKTPRSGARAAARDGRALHKGQQTKLAIIDAALGLAAQIGLEGLSIGAEGMIGDLHGTPEYRAHLVKVLTRRAVAGNSGSSSSHQSSA